MSARRIGTWLLCLSLTLSGSRASSLGSPLPARADTLETPSRFDPDSVKPARGSARKAVLEAMAQADYVKARALAVAALPREKAAELPLLRWLGARAARELGEPHAAAELLLPVARGEHPLASWAKLSVAECHESKDPEQALALVDSLLLPSREVQGFPGRSAAERLRARVLDRLGRRSEAIAVLERLAETRDESSTLSVLAPLSELLASGSVDDRERAYGLARLVSLRAPDTRAGRRAEELAASLLSSLPEARRRELARPHPEDKLLRADALMGALKYAEAEAVYAEIEAQAGDDVELSCRARFGRAKALIDRRARAEGSALMAEVAARCTHDGEQRVWARYHAGRAYSALGRNELAIAQFEALEQESPAHSLADDALYRAAKAASDLGDSAGLVTRLRAVAERYPHGDMQPRARFALAWEAYQRADFDQAIALVSEDDRDEPSEDLQGRSLYFRARWLSDQGQRERAIDAFATTFERTPLAFYGQLAYAQLRALAPQRAKALASKLTRARGQRLTFEQRPELASAGFARAHALFSVNEVALAQTELRGLGFTAESADVELALLSVALLDRVNAPDLALSLARRHMPRLLNRAPLGPHVGLYELVYPVAFASLIESTAKKEGVPAALVRAIAREESGFNPNAVSRAHAYGLVQLLLPTARSLVKSKKERVRDGSALLRPELNLTLGARFMAGMAASFRGQYALVPPAYNAGPGAVSRWVRERGQQRFDDWVESIPYDETRHYTRRVLQSYGIYHWLATGELVTLPLGPVGTLGTTPAKPAK